MTREMYVKPDVRSDVLEPEALCCTGSNQTKVMLSWFYNASCGVCCETSNPCPTTTPPSHHHHGWH
jgi:hypothetical protein